jgi:cell division protein FtsB
MKRRKHSSGKIRFFILLAILIIPIFYLGKKVYRFGDTLLEERRLKKEVVILQAENEVLKQRIDDYKKGSLIEAKAREELGMIKKGEKIYIIRKK